ncbi:hypothetical protein FIM10_18680 [Sphingomonadales bacterium 56]|uniref:Uncharacterized protein n=1 Tax=Sphingobium indicum TaxID=332055 RepID=A0A4Q4ISN9_9SPHN|nr:MULTISPECIES: hypothetical protein [Sphingobium]MBY2930709.1 hypothetical protein [Sphingomonadales bacterium 56]MBY2960749.1 hypothetical protein [Sphingomonadales bacterium 58]NYI25013.1 hypothetical protein [Sphingobium indicum]RYL96483.1 hypothetical protein EWH08_19690 [Sphingobium indicum]CAD7341791.1 hypothetical protein SPHS6_03762 [Sphingobium sp. S6]
MRSPETFIRKLLAKDPHPGVSGLIIASLYLGFLCAFAAMIAVAALHIFKQHAVIVGGAMHLTDEGRILLYLLLAGMYFGSVVLRGVGKALLRSKYMPWAWLLATGIVAGIGMGIFTVRINSAISALHGGATNSNGVVLAFFGVWLLFVGIAVSGIADEAADRIANWTKRWIAA